MIDLGLDRYDIDARLKPAFLTVAPVVLSLAVWLGLSWPITTTFISATALCGGTYLMSRYARHRGRIIQEELVRQLGALPSTILLRHQNNRINAITKLRYHEYLRSKNLHVPSPEEETEDPVAADRYYTSCADYLRANSRDRKIHSLVFNENVDFGFRRNLLGLRPLALVLLTSFAIVNATVVGWEIASFHGLPWGKIALETLLAAALVFWLFGVSLDFVADAGWSYADRLLATCESSADTER